MGPIEVPADVYWAAQTQRSIQNFPDWRGPLQVGPADHPRARHPQEGGRTGQRRARRAPGRGGRSDRACGRRGDRRRPRRAVPARRVPDRLGHAVEHERQRGHRQPCGGADRRHRRRRSHHPPERPRQPRTVLERHVPDGHAHRGRGAAAAAPVPGGGQAARHAGRQVHGLRRTSSRPAGRTCRTPRRSRSARRSARGWRRSTSGSSRYGSRCPGCTTSPSAVRRSAPG